MTSRNPWFAAFGLGIVILLSLANMVQAAEADVEKLLDTVKAVGPSGGGHRDASQAVAQLSQLPAERLPQLLAGMNGASPLANNWLRAAIETVTDRQLAAGGKLPLPELNQFLTDTKHNPQARRLAYELIARVDADAPHRFLPTMLNDPSLELRYDAVEHAVAAAKRKMELAKVTAPIANDFRKALTAARDLDQVKRIAEELKNLGEPVDLAQHFGYITHWKLIGPFDNVDKKGYPIAYPPEQQLQLTAEMPGKVGPVKWFDHTAADELGEVDLNKAIGKHMGAIGYAVADFVVDEARDAEIRVSSICAVKVFLNGKPVVEREIYHASTGFDQYVAPVKLQPGSNVILVKVCQNEQKEEWAQDWSFKLRVCDSLGTAILAKNRPASTTAKTGATE